LKTSSVRSRARTKAFAYLRVSGKGQIDGDGFPRQELAIKRYAEQHNVRVVRVFREEGLSGETELENRPALMQLMEALAADGVKLVLIEKLDRLARNLMVQETIIGDLRKRGFELISVTEPDLLQNDPTRVLMRQIFGAIAQYEKAMIVAKLRGARDRIRKKTGVCEGRKPFGHYENEKATLERMKALREEGLSFEAIAEVLNQENLQSRSGKAWQPRSLHRILTRTT
jgi:DNA invertase Pin-like site-specific DNA recombinase